jgi:chitobiase/beta-hexosaminidase-like protein
LDKARLMAARSWPRAIAVVACVLACAPAPLRPPIDGAAASPAASRLTVSASPPAGTYPSEQVVTLRSSAPGTIYYTTDGTDPSPNSDSHVRHVYQTPLAIPVTTTLKFVAVDADRTSKVVTARYTITFTAGDPDFSILGSHVPEPTADKAESKLWFNDGSWWGCLYNPTAQAFRIYRFDRDVQAWFDTDVTIDGSRGSRADVLWDGRKLYIVSGDTAASDWGRPAPAAALAAGSARLLRFSYDPAAKTYTRDPGFPVTVRQGSAEDVTLAKDSTGELWIAFTREGRVWVNHSLGDDAEWGKPFTPQVAGTTVHYDDIPAIVAFGGDKIGLMWSNQIDRRFYFAVHRDGDAPAVWQPSETAFGGGVNCNTGCANDHLNLQTDPAGSVYAGVKTANRNTGQLFVELLVRDPSGAWSAATFGRVEDEHSRPRVVIDDEHRRLYMFATIRETGGAIFYKTTCLDNIAFAPGPGTPAIQNPEAPAINNATSTKQNVDSETGLLVLASDSAAGRYLHAYFDLTAMPPCD